MGEVVVNGGAGMDADMVVRTEAAKNMRETDDKDGSLEVVRREKFLPRMVLRVLLVEADDSTRQVITALLRKCSYKVTAVPDGLMAWETLKGSPHNIDLILTEVELPSISGYALLTLIMEHDICKNIPVIMMSSHDSISMVLKCMLKGAADFLIKPVRRNELRNLWQHVWRRQTQGFGHIPRDSPYIQHKVGSQNNSASDHSSECATSRKRKEMSDEGSDLQVLSQVECRISANTSYTEEEKNKNCVVLNEKKLIPDRKAIDSSTRSESVCASLNEDHNTTALELGEEFTCCKIWVHDGDVKPENNRENVNSFQGHNSKLTESSGGAIDLIGTFDDGLKGTYGHLKRHHSTEKFESTPELELSLTRCFPNDSKNPGVEGRDALNHSNVSAFSWYTGKILQPLFPTLISKCTEFNENARESVDQSSNAVGQKVNGNSQKNGANLVIGQCAEAELSYQNTQKLVPSSGAGLDNACNGYIHTRHPVSHSNKVGQEGLSLKMPSLEQEDSPTTTSSTREIHHYNGTSMNSVDQPNNGEVVDEVRRGSSTCGHSRSSSMSNSAADHNNSSAYGDFTSRSDGNASFAVTSERATVSESLNDDSGRLIFRYGSTQREAALTKFRLKRKVRCYQKKVRYQSRKRLAEQRPRVKGQFVRQVQNDA